MKSRHASQLGGPFWVLSVNWPGKQSFHLVGPTQGQFFSVSSARANWLNIHAHTRIHAHTPPVFLRVHKPFLRMPMSVRWVIFQQKFYYTVWRQWAVSPSVSTKIAAAKQILSKCQTKLIFRTSSLVEVTQLVSVERKNIYLSQPLTCNAIYTFMEDFIKWNTQFACCRSKKKTKKLPLCYSWGTVVV